MLQVTKVQALWFRPWQAVSTAVFQQSAVDARKHADDIYGGDSGSGSRCREKSARL